MIKRFYSNLIAQSEKDAEKLQAKLTRLEKQWVAEQSKRYGGNDKIPQSELDRWRKITGYEIDTYRDSGDSLKIE